MNSKKRVLSGIRSTGQLHLGNYYGAIKGMVELQDNSDYETFYMVADAHTVTTPYDIEALRLNRREIVVDYLSAGLDPEKSVIFQQANIGAHMELAFYFSSVTTVAKVSHLPTFKEKVKQYPDHVTLALLNYPTLMAADILIYKASLVPVGPDQEPHIEISREIARRFNQEYGTDFPEPERFATSSSYVPSLSGEGKMSKSIPGSYINLTDDLETIEKRLAGVPTDGGQGKSVPKTGGVASLLGLVELIEGTSKRIDYEEQYTSTSGSGIRYGELKKQLARSIYDDLTPFRENRARFEADRDYVDGVIEEGSKKAREFAETTVLEVKQKLGLA